MTLWVTHFVNVCGIARNPSQTYLPVSFSLSLPVSLTLSLCLCLFLSLRGLGIGGA